MNCTYAGSPDENGRCPECGAPLGASGCDGGSWVHMSEAPDRVVVSEYSYGRLVRQKLANGVIIKYKPAMVEGGVEGHNRESMGR